MSGLLHPARSTLAYLLASGSREVTIYATGSAKCAAEAIFNGALQEQETQFQG